MDGSPTPPPAAKTFTKAEIRTILIGIMLSTFVAQAGQNIVSPALPKLSAQLGAPDQAAAIVTSFLVAGMASTPIFGKLCDTWGRRPALALTLAFFIVGSVLCAFAPSMPYMIAARAIQGIGGGALIAMTLTILADVVPPKERGNYQPYLLSAIVVAQLAGPAMGGYIIDHFPWPVIFWACAGMGVLALLASEATLKGRAVGGTPQKIDILGAVLLVGACVTLMTALGSAKFSLIKSGLAIAFWALFVWRLLKTSKPLIPLRILRNSVVRNASLANGFAANSVLILATFLPSVLQKSFGLTAAESGLALGPIIAATSIGNIFGGQVSMRFRHYKRFAQWGLMVGIAACIGAVFAAHAKSLWAIEAMIVVMTIGIGVAMPITMISMQNGVERSDLGVATSNVNFMRQLNGALMIAAAGLAINRLLPLGVGSAEVIFAASAVSALIAYVFLWRMEEKPLRG
jgi:MFS family permease